MKAKPGPKIVTSDIVMAGALGVVLVAVITLGILTLIGPSIGNVFSSCTLILGSDYTAVTLDGDVPASYTLELTANSTEIEATCGADQTGVSSSDGAIRVVCLRERIEIQHLDRTLDDLTITIRWEGGAKTEIFHPVYETWYPNGEHCPPDRRRAALNMHLP